MSTGLLTTCRLSASQVSFRRLLALSIILWTFSAVSIHPKSISGNFFVSLSVVKVRCTWWTVLGSNQSPPACKTGALPK